jgi:hypothetical protein
MQAPKVFRMWHNCPHNAVCFCRGALKKARFMRKARLFYSLTVHPVLTSPAETELLTGDSFKASPWHMQISA